MSFNINLTQFLLLLFLTPQLPKNHVNVILLPLSEVPQSILDLAVGFGMMKNRFGYSLSNPKH